MDSFREQLSSRSSEYVEEILSPYFGGIIQFVKEGESLVEKGQADQLKKQESKQIKQYNYIGSIMKFACLDHDLFDNFVKTLSI